MEPVTLRRHAGCMQPACNLHAAVVWLWHYLSDRTQMFNLSGVTSKPRTLNCSVPQGSVLGPMEFIAYTADTTCNVQYYLYAVNKQAYVHIPVSELQSAQNVLQVCTANVGQWCASRRLQLNASKTELIWFGLRQHLAEIPSNDLLLSVKSGIIHPVNFVRDLGVLLDSELGHC
jgi:hypothetical protein